MCLIPSIFISSLVVTEEQEVDDPEAVENCAEELEAMEELPNLATFTK